jgi:hypothetical protein
MRHAPVCCLPLALPTASPAHAELRAGRDFRDFVRAGMYVFAGAHRLPSSSDGYRIIELFCRAFLTNDFKITSQSWLGALNSERGAYLTKQVYPFSVVGGRKLKPIICGSLRDN